MARSASPASNTLRGSRVVSGTTRKDTPGALCASTRTRPGISSAAVASAMVSTKVLLASAGSNTLGAREACSFCKVSRTAGHSSCPRAVGSRVRPWRTSSSSSSASRRRRKALLTAGWVRLSCSAARVRLRSDMTTSNTLSRFRSKVRRLMRLLGMANYKSCEYQISPT